MPNIPVLDLNNYSRILSLLDQRDIALWIEKPFADSVSTDALADLIRLPWSVVLSDAGDEHLIENLEMSEPIDSALVRRRGFVQIVDGDPRDVVLPPRSMPLLLLNGRASSTSRGMAAAARRINMLQELTRRSVKQLVILCGPSPTVPDDFDALWSDGFRTSLTVVSDDPDAQTNWSGWLQTAGAQAIGLHRDHPEQFCRRLYSEFVSARGERQFLRIRSIDGKMQRLDVSGLDDPEHPLLGAFQLLADSELAPLMPEDLSVSDIETFFKDAAGSWRPYAAGMPWQRDETSLSAVHRALRRLDRGPRADASEAHNFFITAESGAGATTFIRRIAFDTASHGYPTLIAGRPPFSPNATDVVHFLTRILERSREEDINPSSERLYEAPCVIIFDQSHWEGREDEAITFVRELDRGGRRAVIIVVTGPYVNLTLEGSVHFRHLTHLTHEVSAEQALALGRHLNKYLSIHGSTRSEGDWRGFYQASAVQAGQGIASFWIALSFWVQRQFDMGETVQSWIYRRFREAVRDAEVGLAIIRIAAFSTERQPLPDDLLPQSVDWPVTEKLSDLQKDIAPLGLIRVRGEQERYWAMIHDLLGRYLLTALFYDDSAKEQYGFSSAQNPEHLRFLALRELSSDRALERKSLREIAESFAVNIFKIDPGHGRATFAPFWREVLSALDEMPRSLWTTSRPFLHHTAVSRRRIAADREQFHMDNEERADLLNRAVRDLEFALTVHATDDAESDMNLLNSLAHAYHDLANVETERGAERSIVERLLTNARERTRQAYALNPDSTFVIETYARDLIAEAKVDPSLAAYNAIEVLNIAYATMWRENAERRRHALGRLADEALEILLTNLGPESAKNETESEASAIAKALHALKKGIDNNLRLGLDEYPPENRIRAAELLAKPILLGNPQAIRLRYSLTCIDQPYSFPLQLELLQSLTGGTSAFSPQMRLEYAVLLHQCDRHFEADRQFRDLRKLWRREDHYVEVPDRIRWLFGKDGTSRRQVHATVTASGEGRYFAKVREFGNLALVFRPQEFPQGSVRPGAIIRGQVSFGHNGPFLRPLTQG
ncbi:MAG: hypothetical protein KL863_20405 [Rhizobium sp.]|nr:hypothetical protein [Rhizobium sp.]